MALEPNALISVDKAQSWGATLSTGQLEDLINAISREFEQTTGREFRSRQVVAGTPSGDQAPLEYYQGTGRQILQLNRWPITAIERIEIDGVEICDFERYPAFLENGQIWRKRGWPISCYRSGGLAPDPDLNTAFFNVSVAYTGGYATTPADLVMACVREVRLNEEAFGRLGIKSEKTPGGYAAAYEESGITLSAPTLALLYGRYSR